jgi:6-phosphogluconate dehydrogenase
MKAHVPTPSLSAAHFMRLTPSDIFLRDSIKASLGLVSPVYIDTTGDQKVVFLEHLRKAVYSATLACYIQGLDLLARVNAREEWSVKLPEVARIWRSGCIIRSDYITDLFERHYAHYPGRHPLCGEEIASEVKRCSASLKQVVLQGVELDAHIPCLSASLEYLKYSGSTDLPTSFTEAQLDCFGAHGFDLKSDPIGNLSKGRSTSTHEGSMA